ncbi:hypothetical protein H0H92_014524 [Tricholoma furcatifolium]|nr:hypothetical protein H0H92_014524 [Tricholoma furcatifolium]
MATIVIDDTTSQLVLGSTEPGSAWSSIPGQQFYGGEATYPAFASNANQTGDSGNYGTLEMYFQGTSIAFIGNTPPSGFSQNIYVSIDGSSAYESWYDDPSPPSSRQWYQSPMLSDGEHTISITHIAGTSIDMMMITAGPNTPLSGQQLIVDDNDEAIVYSGSWSSSSDTYTQSDMPHTGTSISVYSLVNYQLLGSVGVTYTLDSIQYFEVYAVTTSTSQYQSGVEKRDNQLLWSSDTLSAGDHTLSIQVESSTNGVPLVLDYLVYTPSFATLSSKPGIGPAAASTSAVATSNTVSPKSETTGTTETTGASMASSIASSSSTAANSSVSFSTGHTVWGTVTISGTTEGYTSGADTATKTGVSAKTRTSIMVGAVVGGVVLLALLLLLLLLFRRRASKGISSAAIPVIAPANSFTIEPFREPNSAARPVTFSPAEKVRNASNLDLYPSNRSRGRHAGAPDSVQGSATCSEKTPLVPTPGLTNDIVSSTSLISPFNPGSPFSGSTTESPHSNVKNLQSLIVEFNRVNLAHGEASARAAELQTQISELAQRNGVDSDTIQSIQNSKRDANAATLAVPPPYES